MTDMATDPNDRTARGGLLAGMAKPSANVRNSRLLTVAGTLLFLPSLVSLVVSFYVFDQAETYEARKALADSIFPTWFFGGGWPANILVLLGIVALIAAYVPQGTPGRVWSVANTLCVVVACLLFLLMLIW